jgi:hypothetical protein
MSSTLINVGDDIMGSTINLEWLSATMTDTMWSLVP